VNAGKRRSTSGVGGVEFSLGSIDWGECDEEIDDRSAECGELEVPLDYDRTDGETIDVSLIRFPAGDPDERIGSILFNPGGPGGSGVDMVGLQVGPLSSLQYPELASRFDLIGFDPRGVDRSNGIRCVDDAWQETHRYIDGTPDTAEEESLLLDSTAGFVVACNEKYGASLIEYDTANTARDMDLIREAVGDEKLTYYGVSYGTILGAVYATLFPDNVRAMVLDSAYDPQGLDAAQSSLIQYQGFEGAYSNWVTWCESNTSCPFGSTSVDARWVALRDQLDTSPIPADDGRLANRDVLVLATITALYAKTTWPLLAAALRDAEAGDGTALFALTDSYNGRDADGTWSTIQQSNPVIACASGLATAAPPDPVAAAASVAAAAPHFVYDTEAIQFGNPCYGLPAGTIPATTYTGEGPILVVGGTNDPATPFVWAEQLSQKLGSAAQLLTFTGEGHGAFFASACVREASVEFLLEATASPTSTCDPDTPAPRPDWFDSFTPPAGFTQVDLLGAEGLLGFDLATMYPSSYVTTSADAGDELVAALESASWKAPQRGPLDLEGATDSEQIILVGSDGTAAAIVMGPTTLQLPDFGAFAAMVPDGSTLVVLVAI
jgi:pimeloyl-ACP methyl ester carboxylesterase